MLVIVAVIYFNSRSRMTWLQRSRLMETQQLPPSSITDFNKAMDDEWLPILRNGTIVSCVPFMSYDAYADKWLATFEDGRVAMLKLVSDPSMFERTIVTLPFDECVHSLPLDNTTTTTRSISRSPHCRVSTNVWS